MARKRKWATVGMALLCVLCVLCLAGFSDWDEAYGPDGMATQGGMTAAEAAAAAKEEAEAEAEAAKEEMNRRMGITENTVFGVTGPDGGVVSGYTWEMYNAKAKERAKDGIRLKIGGNQIEFPDQKPVIEEGRVLVPMRPVLESAYVQCRVVWDGDAGRATIRDQGGREVVFVPGQHSYTIVNASGVRKDYPLDVAPKILDGRVMLPLRVLLETFRYKVEWYADEQLILAYDTYPSWRKLLKPEEWQKALEEDCVPCALVKEAP